MVAAPTACGIIQFSITGSNAVTTTFPAASCGTGLIVVRGGAATWNGTTRVLTLPVRIKNTSGQTIEQPIWTRLPDTGRLVTEPSGQSPTLIVPQTPADSIFADKTTVWLIGASSNLAIGDSTIARTLRFKVTSPVTSGQLAFGIQTNEVIVGMPATAPNVRPAWPSHDSSKTFDGLSIKRVLLINFRAGTAVSEKQAAIDVVQGSVVGGSPWITDAAQGLYFVRVPWATTLQMLDSASKVLRSNAAIASATPESFLVLPGRRPNDRTSGTSTWKASDWTFNPDSSGGSNWAPEELALPLALGCETGRPSTSVGIVDQNFKPGNFGLNVVGGVPVIPGDPDTGPHGSSVASVLAAGGDDSVGMAGSTWTVSLSLKALGFAKTKSKVLAALDSLMKAGVSIINLSLGLPIAPTANLDTLMARPLCLT